MDIDRFRVDRPGDADLSRWDPGDDGGLDREAAEAETTELGSKLAALHERLHASDTHRVLAVFQAMDAGGKDGVIRHVLAPLNPEGVRVVNFKVPSEEELAHDYLWRVHPHTPAAGELAVFNRSHYEDVLVVRVHDLVPRERWSARYRHICEFERLLSDEGTTIVKFLLLISRDEQRQRFEDRLNDPEKRWKFRVGDLEERKLWDQYHEAFTDMLANTCEPVPWWVIPADRKWFRNRVVSEILHETLTGLRLEWPAPEENLDGVTIT